MLEQVKLNFQKCSHSETCWVSKLVPQHFSRFHHIIGEGYHRGWWQEQPANSEEAEEDEAGGGGGGGGGGC